MSNKKKKEPPSRKTRIITWATTVAAFVGGLTLFVKNIDWLRERFGPRKPEIVASITSCSRREILLHVENKGSAASRLTSARILAMVANESQPPIQTLIDAAAANVEPKKSVDIKLIPAVGQTPLALPLYPQPCTIKVAPDFVGAVVEDLPCPVCPPS